MAVVMAHCSTWRDHGAPEMLRRSFQSCVLVKNAKVLSLDPGFWSQEMLLILKPEHRNLVLGSRCFAVKSIVQHSCRFTAAALQEYARTRSSHVRMLPVEPCRHSWG